ncbi:uncharacterized protein B0H18DRAFT_1116523 [Fomitopsis serialis]|uniref:uncharacterized protein n=1 Tax=Fomitopsis serialis TaxID=139415 RepID=UPI002007D745|nr:uncharacterized protein B0H18DRAFT_1116523 [Neoantrodia serialis]KAH9931369.1 hypothetical protein B0H18DRAFT_1116523 [Neoantrodia serialis]
MPRRTSAPKCYTCIVEPKRGIDQHSWLVKTAVDAWKAAGPNGNYNQTARTVADQFAAQFDPNILATVEEPNKPPRLETEEECFERCGARRRTKIVKWMENHRAWIQEQVSSTPRLLELPTPPTQQSQKRRKRAKSARDLFKRAHPEVAKAAREAATANGVTVGAELSRAAAIAVSEAAKRMQTEDPEAWDVFERASAASKREMREKKGGKGKGKAGGEDSESDGEERDDEAGEDDEGKDEDIAESSPKVAPLEEMQSRIRYTAHASVDEWAKNSGMDVFVYLGWVDAEGRARKFTASAGKGGRDDLSTYIKNERIADRMDAYMLKTRDLELRPVNTQMVAGPAGSSRPVPAPAGPSEHTDPVRDQVSRGTSESSTIVETVESGHSEPAVDDQHAQEPQRVASPQTNPDERLDSGDAAIAPSPFSGKPRC